MGKSPSVRNVYYTLKRKGYSTLLEQWQGEPEVGDIIAIFDVRGVKVGIESQGDPGCDMEATMEAFVQKGCDIIVTACRTKSTTYDKVWKYLGKEQGYDILECPNYRYSDTGANETLDALNQIYAEHVVRLIEDRINNKF